MQTYNIIRCIIKFEILKERILKNLLTQILYYLYLASFKYGVNGSLAKIRGLISGISVTDKTKPNNEAMVPSLSIYFRNYQQHPYKVVYSILAWIRNLQSPLAEKQLYTWTLTRYFTALWINLVPFLFKFFSKQLFNILICKFYFGTIVVNILLCPDPLVFLPDSLCL